jgi:hypothetical protein
LPPPVFLRNPGELGGATAPTATPAELARLEDSRARQRFVLDFADRVLAAHPTVTILVRSLEPELAIVVVTESDDIDVDLALRAQFIELTRELSDPTAAELEIYAASGDLPEEIAAALTSV